MTDAVQTLPCRVRVKRVIEGRYREEQVAQRGVIPHRTELMLGLAESRPLDWGARTQGIDLIETEDGRTVKLFSDGGQSVPKPGWVLLLRDGDAERGYAWTLFGIPAQSIAPAA
jgi:hypothetical protein